MNMKNILKAFVVVLLIALSGCSKTYFDVNTPSNVVDVSQLSMNDLLGPVILNTVNAQYGAESSFGNYDQNFTGDGGTSEGVTSIAGTWSDIYLYALPSLKVIRAKAKALHAKHFDAVAEILTAINLGLATDSWGSIPYSKATLGSADLTPAYDTQDTIYNDIFDLLDNAISELKGPDNSGFAPSATSDLIYRGDLGKWLRAAYTLKARYELHLIKRIGAVKAANAALVAIANGFTSNSDDFQMFYTEKHINPWYSREVLDLQTGNLHDNISYRLVSYMDGTSYPFTGGVVTMDPRLPVYAQTDDGSNDYKGYLSGGDGVTGDGVTTANTNFRANGFYTSETSPIVIISYAEALFIKAEAAFLANGGTITSSGTTATGYAAYIDGIKANMEKLNISPTKYNNYLADPSVNVGAANLKLQNIMKEKYIADFLNPETYVDMRRYDHSTDVFKGLKLRADNATSVFPGQWYARATYPSTEITRNPVNESANQKSPVVPVWWAQ